MSSIFVRCFINRSLKVNNIIRRTLTASSTASPLYALRRKTGFAYSLCRQALEKNENNIQQSEDWLKAYALTHGLQRASNLQSRVAKEGLIGLTVTNNFKTVTLLELNCETDFVAKNKVFRDFALDINVRYSGILSDQYKREADQIVTQKKFEDHEIEQIAKEVNSVLVTRLGENVKLGRALRITANQDDLKLFYQVHPQMESESLTKTQLGRVACVICLRDVVFDLNNSEPARLLTVGNRLCNHIIAYSPDYIRLPFSIRQQLEAMQSNQSTEQNDYNSDIKTEPCLDEHEEIKQDDAEPRKENPCDDWPSLLDQTLIMSEDTIVEDFCSFNKVEVVFFKRFECGINTDET